MLSFREILKTLSPVLDQVRMYLKLESIPSGVVTFSVLTKLGLFQGNVMVLQQETVQMRCNQVSAAISNGWKIEEFLR